MSLSVQLSSGSRSDSRRESSNRILSHAMVERG